jgi:CelD/BcsL family acetyltransferase involved in cellulose biosynthesis
VPDFRVLETRWRALEATATPSFFQSWSWIGCLAAERFPKPRLLAAQIDGRDVALALFNQGRSRLSPVTLWLGESGIADFDALYVEHNGVLAADGHDNLLSKCLAATLRHASRIVLSGVDDAQLQAARATGAVARLVKSQPAPFVDFSKLAGPWLAGLSANARYQLRRSVKRYAARGTLALHRATTLPDAMAVLDDLARLHQTTWTARGRPGAFANPTFRRFHEALIETALPRGEIDLLRITAGKALVGCLYNFRHRGHVLAYQSGFDHQGAGDHEKPGLTCHHLAIEAAQADGMTRYDFLAGDDRYKTSLASDATTLHWLDLNTPWSLRGLATRLGVLT